MNPMKVLHIDSSILGDHSVSRRLSAKVVEHLRHSSPGTEVTYRDLADEPLAHVSPAYLTPNAPAEVQAQQAEGQTVLDEFLAADAVVIGAPMYNFTIPSQLKSWIDRLVVAGKTFRYTDSGPVGLVEPSKKVIIVSTRGGLYGHGTPGAVNDFQEPYLRAVLAFIGVTNVEFVRAEGVAYGPEVKQAALDAADAQIAELAVA